MVVYTGRIWRRFLAFGFDSFIAGLCFLPAWLQLFGSWMKSQTLAVDWNWIALGFTLQLFYKWLFLYFLGGTLGKLIFGLRVVSIHHPERGLGLLQSLLRVLTDYLSIFFGHALRALALMRLDRTHVSDWVAETRVVQFAKPTAPTQRRVIVALLIMIFSFSSQFQSLYRAFQTISWQDGQFVVENEDDESR